MADKEVPNQKQVEKQPLVEDNSNKDERIPENLHVTEEERRGTISEFTTATAVDLLCSRVTANPVVEQGPTVQKSKK